MSPAYETVKSKALNVKTTPQWQFIAWLHDAMRENWRATGNWFHFLCCSIVMSAALAAAAIPLVVFIPIMISAADVLYDLSSVSSEVSQEMAVVVGLTVFSWICSVTAVPWVQTRILFQFAAANIGMVSSWVATRAAIVGTRQMDTSDSGLTSPTASALNQIFWLSWFSTLFNCIWNIALIEEEKSKKQ